MSAAVPAPDVGVAILDRLDRILAALERGTPGARDPDALLRVREAAAEFAVDAKTLRSQIALGRIPCHNGGVRQSRVRRGDVEAWLVGRRRS